MWWMIVIICVVFGVVCQPVGRWIGRSVSSKWMAISLQLVAYWCILMALYGCALLMGYNIFN